MWVRIRSDDFGRFNTPAYLFTLVNVEHAVGARARPKLTLQTTPSLIGLYWLATSSRPTGPFATGQVPGLVGPGPANPLPRDADATGPRLGRDPLTFVVY